MNKKLVNLLIGIQFLTKLCQLIYNVFSLNDFIQTCLFSNDTSITNCVYHITFL